MARFYLGVDGGQSSTTALISNDEGQILGKGSGGPCNHVSAAEGRTKFFEAVGQSVGAACEQAGLNAASTAFSAACLGFSGGAADKEEYSRELVRSTLYKVTHDAEIALTGATAAEPGIIIIAGTGSMAFGRNAMGKTARAGGWGYVFGDEGGGFDLTRQALRAALRYEEGWGPYTTLHALLLAVSGAGSANALLHRFYTPDFPRFRIAAFSASVTEAAEQGDSVARELVQAAAAFLTSYVQGVYSHLFAPGDRLMVTHAGGVFRSSLLAEEFAASVRTQMGCDVTEPLYSPAAGALLEALRLDGKDSQLTNWNESDK